ncbi:MAG: Na/Pi cotransporter family protein [Lachnospiraceae bacterium]|nr:Na/Pi cotransporter family protein [Lachnospiraceae bacterium]
MYWIEIILPLIGGLALFLYGMTMMSDGLQRAAGNRLRRWLEVLTKNRFFAVIAGTIVTAAVQSSTATTVMVVGFVNAGLMRLSQAASVVMGANIGSTFTGMLIAFRISLIAPIAAFIGIMMILAAKKKKIKSIGTIIAGIGILFVGMNMMSASMQPLSTNEEFMGLIVKAQVPIIGLLVGALLTAVLQSSSAMIGILIALATAGILDLQTGVFILFGANIGTCITAIIASLGATKIAKRAAVVHLLFNIIGAIIFSIIVLLPFGFINMIERLFGSGVSMQLAGTHIVFSVVTTLILLPFVKQLIWLASLIVRGEDKPREELRLLYIEPQAFNAPSIAAAQVRKEVERMAEIALKNYSLSVQVFLEKRTDLIEDVLINEEVIDFLDNEITRYLVDVSVMELEDIDRERINSLYQVINHIERIGDHAENIVEFASAYINKGRAFSDEAMNDIITIEKNAQKILTLATSVFLAGTYDENAIDIIHNSEREMYAEVQHYKANHLERSKTCISERNIGLIFNNILENSRRIVHHAGGMVRSLDYQKTAAQQRPF